MRKFANIIGVLGFLSILSMAITMVLWMIYGDKFWNPVLISLICTAVFNITYAIIED